MPRRPSRLSNCYVPIVVPGSNNTKKDGSHIHNSGVRRDEREYDELRQVVLETSIIGPALGSSLVEFGHTKVLCEVHMVSSGGSNKNNNNNSNNNNNNSIMVLEQQQGTSNNNVEFIGRLYGMVQFAPHIGMNQTLQRAQAVGSLNNNDNAMVGGVSSGKMNQQVVMQETELSHQLTSALLPVVALDKYPKCTLVVQATIIQDSGCCLSAAITAATLALVDAGVELLDLVTSCTVAVIVQQQQQQPGVLNSDNDDNNIGDHVTYLVDPTEEEILAAQTIICLAMTPNHKEITLWSQSGKLSGKMVSDAMNLCRDGCRTYHKILREFWINKLTTSSIIR
jgi:exosome complex component MTR3